MSEKTVAEMSKIRNDLDAIYKSNSLSEDKKIKKLKKKIKKYGGSKTILGAHAYQLIKRIEEDQRLGSNQS